MLCCAMPYAVLFMLFATPSVLTVAENNAGTSDNRPEVVNENGNAAILARLERLEGRLDEKERQWLKDRQDWRREKQSWEREKVHLQLEKGVMQSQIFSLQHKVAVLESELGTPEHVPVQISVDSQSESAERSTPAEASRPNDHDLFRRSDMADSLQPMMSQMNQRVTEVEAELQTVKNSNLQQDKAIFTANVSGSSTFVRWGHSSCPSSEELVYSGYIGGAWYGNVGSTTNAFCMPPNPRLETSSKPAHYDSLYGAEYKTEPDSTDQKDPVCAVCRIHRATTIMVPATTSCENDWTLEYHGYLMGSYHSDHGGHEGVCVDRSLESRPGSSLRADGFLLYFLFTVCGSLPCPPYQDSKLITCAVCSK